LKRQETNKGGATCAPKCKSSMAQVSQVLKAVIAGMSKGTWKAKSSAAVLLYEELCALKSSDLKDNRLMVGHEGGIPALIAIVRDGTAEGKAKAVAALDFLSVEDENKVLIAREQGIPALVELTKSGTTEGKEKAEGILWNINVNNDNEVLTACIGGFPALLVLMQHGSKSKGKPLADIAIRALWRNDSDKLEKSANAACISSLIDLLKNGTDDSKGFAANIIKVLCRDEECAEKVLKAGGIPPLIALLRDGTSDSKSKAADALVNVSHTDERSAVIAKEGGVGPIIALLRDGDTVASKSAALDIIRNMCNNRNVGEGGPHDLVVKEGGLKPVIAVLGDSAMPAKEKANAALVLRLLARRAEHAETMAGAGSVKALIQLIRDGSIEEKREGTTALFNLSIECQPNRTVIIEEGGLAPLIAIARSEEDSETSNFSKDVLRKISGDSQERRDAIKAAGYDI
jgi:hypothetical protein